MYYIWRQPWNALTVINKIVFTSPEAMVEFSGEKGKTLALVKNQFNICKFIFVLKVNVFFSLNVNKILRLQVTLDSRHPKNVIRYAFQHIYLRQPESHFRVINFGRDVAVDDGGNHVTFYGPNVCIKIKK